MLKMLPKSLKVGKIQFEILTTEKRKTHFKRMHVENLVDVGLSRQEEICRILKNVIDRLI